MPDTDTIDPMMEQPAQHKAVPRKVKSDSILQVWLIHDARPGHLTQLKGLASRLAAHQGINVTWIDAINHLFSWKQAFLGKPKTDQSLIPDLIIGAGHKTHKLVLLTAHQHQAFSAVLMKPSLPNNWFDAIISPRHDGLTESKRVLNTTGTVNRIDPPQVASLPQTNLIRNQNLQLDRSSLSRQYLWRTWCQTKRKRSYLCHA